MPLNRTEKVKFFDAAEHNNLTAVKYFVEEEGASLQLFNEQQETLLHIAARNGYADLAKYVLKKEPSIVADKDHCGSSAFFLANQKGATDIVRYLLEEHGEAVMRGKDRHFLNSAMHLASEFGHLDTLKYFIEQKQSDVNTLNGRHEPLIYTAVEYKQHHVVKYLVKQGADLTLLNKNHANIIFPTVATNDLELMRYFFDERKAPIDVNWQDKFGNTLLHRTAFMNRTSIMKYLVEEKHANVNIAGDEEKTPLHYAASRDNLEICRYLIEHGADLGSKDMKGETPIQKTFDKTLIEYLRKVTRAARSRRSVITHSAHSVYNPQQLLSTSRWSPVANLEGNQTPSVSVEVYSPRWQNFLVMVDFIVRSTRRLSRTSESDAFWSPPTTLHGKVDPIAIESVALVFDE